MTSSRTIPALPDGPAAFAIVVSLVSLVFFDLMGMVIKHLSSDYSAAELSAYRNIFGLIPSVIALWSSRSWHQRGRRLRVPVETHLCAWADRHLRAVDVLHVSGPDCLRKHDHDFLFRRAVHDRFCRVSIGGKGGRHPVGGRGDRFQSV